MKKNFTSRTIRYVIKTNPLIAGGILLTAAAVVSLSLIPPQILKQIIDTQIAVGKTEKLLLLASTYLGILVAIALFDFLKAALLTAFGQKIRKEARMGLMRKLERLPISYFSKHTMGETAGHMIQDVDAVDGLFSDGIMNMLIDCFKIIGIVISIGLFSIPMGMVVLVIIPVIYLLTRFFQKRMLAAQINNLEQLGKVNHHIAESVKNIHMVQSFGKEKYMEENYDTLLSKNYKTLKKVNFYDSCYAPLIQLIRATAVAVLVVVTVQEKMVFGITIGMLAAAIEYINNLFLPIENLGMEIQSIQKGISGASRMNQFGEQKEERKRELIIEAKEMEVQFCNVSFYYEEKHPILTDFSLLILPKEQVVLIGRTGVGKSTLFKLLIGLLEPVKGRVLVNGIDICDISHSIKRKLFGYVEQSFQFVEGNVYHQISLGESDIDSNMIERTMEMVGLHSYILKLPQGYLTRVDSEKHFSQGQKQLLGIARAIILNPPVLLFDEMTSNMDSATEEEVISVIKEVCRDRTILTISHRLSGILTESKIIELQ